MANIECSGVTKIYQKQPAVSQVNIDMADGEFVVIVGPSGCGKSSLLRMIAGLEEISDGTISIGGKVVNKLEPKERDIAMVFQNYALYPHMSVYDNMAYGLKNRRVPKAQIKAQIDKAVDILQLEPDMLTRKPRQLSGGQRQRVAMGRAIVREPQAFLFDEPLSNLDAKLRVQMRIEIKHLHELLGVTTVYVTHDQVEAMTLAQKLVVMNGGKVEQIGTPSEIYSAPASEFVATFIGSPSMNLLTGEVSEDGSHILIGEGTHWPLARNLSEICGQAVSVGIRPEHLSINGDTTNTDSTSSTVLTVDLVENLGADALVHGRLRDTPVVVRLPGNADIAAGDTLNIQPDSPASLHLFDSKTGSRLSQSC